MVMNYDGSPEPGAPTDGSGGVGTVPPGTVIGERFRIESLVGQGGLGQLYRALDLKSEKPIAIRLLAPDLAGDEPLFEALRAQVKSASALQHKNIASTFGMGKEAHLRYIAQEFVDGQSLRQLIEKKRRAGRTFSLKGAYNVLAHVCNALDHAHKTMVHGLPGPGVVLINKVGRIKVCEFGVICGLPPQAPAIARHGDAHYIAPETADDPRYASPASDIYSLGMVLHELVTGRLPGSDRLPPSQLIVGLPADVDEVLARCLAADPGQRFGDPQQLKAAFYAAVQGAQDRADVEGTMSASVAVVARPPTPPRPPQGPLTPQFTGPLLPSALPAPGLGAQPFPAASPSVTSPPVVAPPQLTVAQHIERARGESGERWLVQKDRLDFGPFVLADLMQQMGKGQFSGDDTVLDQETGERARIRTHPLFRDFCVALDRHLEAERVVKAEAAQHQSDRRRRTMLILIGAGAFIVLGVGGAITAYYLAKKPETRERIVFREKAGDLENLMKGIDITWKAEPPDQAARRKKIRARRPKGKGVAGSGSDDVQYLGDATKEGGDGLLSESVVQRVMQTNFRKLVPCVYEELRRNPGMRQINIDFGVRGSGMVSSATVNGQAGGPFVGCILAKMQHIAFPKFDGTLTRASFSMTLK
jgi:serine/threonine-protein kinase